jgi:putative colanic acid biosynthesis acetyltransferase WcaF
MQNLKTFKIPKGFRGRSLFIVQIWNICYALFFRYSPRIFNSWRRWLLKLFGARIGNSVLIRPSAKILYPWKLKIGDWSWIGENVTLYCMGEIEIGRNTVISQNSYICTGSHDYKKESFDIFSKKIVIGDKVWIASDVFVFPGVTINDGVVVSARSTVINDLPAEMVCGGNPAKPEKPR